MSPLSLRILKILHEHPLGLAKTRIAAITEQPLHNVELSLKSLAKREYVQELEIGAFKLGPLTLSDEQVEGELALLPKHVPYDPRASKPRKVCAQCFQDKSVIAFFAGDHICRACRKVLGGGPAPGKPLDVTPPAVVPHSVDPPSQRIDQAPQKLPIPTVVQIVLNTLEAEQRGLTRAIEVLKEIYA